MSWLFILHILLVISAFIRLHLPLSILSLTDLPTIPPDALLALLIQRATAAPRFASSNSHRRKPRHRLALVRSLESFHRQSRWKFPDTSLKRCRPNRNMRPHSRVPRIQLPAHW